MPEHKKPSHLTELIGRLSEGEPDILLLQETWLDNNYETINLPGYHLLARRDRKNGKIGYGGVAVYCQNNFNDAVPIYESNKAERIWVTICTDFGPFLISNWYRPPDAQEEETTSLETGLK